MSHNAKMNAIQIAWLNAIRKDRRRVTIFLSNGRPLVGAVVSAFDLHTIRVRVGNALHLVSKTNVVSVVPELRTPKAKKIIVEPTSPQALMAQPQVPVVTIKRRRSMSCA